MVNDKGESAKAGYLVLNKPWPAMLRGIYRDPERYRAQYWSSFPGVYFTGDGAKRDEDGYFWLLGRVDDVMNISGHRVSTMEVESALVDHPLVAEAAVIGRPHEIKGQAIAAFVTVRDGTKGSKELMEEIKQHVAKKIGALARPDDLIFSADLPKTRSGKIMRRLLRDIAEGRRSGTRRPWPTPGSSARSRSSTARRSRTRAWAADGGCGYQGSMVRIPTAPRSREATSQRNQQLAPPFRLAQACSPGPARCRLASRARPCAVPRPRSDQPVHARRVQLRPGESVEISRGRPAPPQAGGGGEGDPPRVARLVTVPGAPGRAMPVEVPVLAEWIADLRQGHPGTSQPSLTEDH